MWKLEGHLTQSPHLIPGSSAGKESAYGMQETLVQFLLVGQLVKNPPAMRETWVQSLGWKDPLEEERSPRVILTPVFLSGEPPWTEEPGR